MFAAVGAVGSLEIEAEELHPVKNTLRPVKMRVERYTLVRISKADSLFDDLAECTVPTGDT